ncbi:MAG: glycosyltransferase family 39 protein [Anaerolineaceae bacterium]|nr:glycosyltransferase family 39 protein [Anaerolineaceae bacterium]
MKVLHWPLLVAIIVLGFGLRLYHLGDVPLRGDEAFTAQNWAGEPLSYSLTHIATIEPHPLLTYVLFRGWGLAAGTSEVAVRALPALSNLLGIAALYALGKRLGGVRIGLLAALLWAVHPFEIWHSQDARNYAIWAGLSAVTLWLGLRSVETRRRGDWLLFLVLAVVTANVFYTELFSLSALALYGVLAYRREWRRLLLWLVVPLLAGSSAVLSFLVLQGQLVGSGAYTGTITEAMNPARLVTWFVPVLNWGDTLPASIVAGVWPVLLVALAIGWLAWWGRNRKYALMLLLVGVLPLLLIGLVSTRFNIFLPRYILSAVPAFILTLSGLALSAWSRRAVLLRFSGVVLLVGWGGAAGLSLNHYFCDPANVKSEDWPELTAYLREYVTPDDLVVQLSIDAAFGYYYAPSPSIALPASPKQPASEIEAILGENSGRAIWLVGQTFTDWPNAGVVESWAQANMQPVHDTRVGRLHIQEYLPWDVAADELSAESLAQFGGVVELVGARVFEMPEPTGELVVWLYWQPLRQTDTPLKVFVHLAGDINPATGSPLWSQDDQFPQDGRVDTTNWAVGDVFRDVYRIPVADVPSGDYALLVGLYDPVTNERLPVGEGDSFALQTVRN